MEINVRARDIVWNEGLQDRVERSIEFAVDRHKSRIPRISVHVSDVNGPRGGVDKLCQITADVRGAQPVMILEKGLNPERTTTMTNNATSLTSMAASPQLPYELVNEPREGHIQDQQPSSAIDILTISDNPTLSVYVSGLFHRSGWTIAHARTCREGVSFLKNNRAAVAVCEESLPDGFWHETAVALSALPDAPALIVVSSDPSLLHEVVALGGFDVLVRPLREADVVWTVASAWHAWRKRFEATEGGVP
jgi:hypothetical protein